MQRQNKTRFVSRSTLFASCTLCLLAVSVMPALRAQGQDAPDKSKAVNATATADELSILQAQLADRYERLEQVVTRLAELSASTDPQRAKLLREALAQARERDISVRYESLVQLLEKDRLSTAVRNQKELTKDLRSLLELLQKENRGSEILKQKKWLKKQIKEVGKIIRHQRGIKARTEGGADTKDLSEDQKKIADRTEKLGNEIESQDEKENAGEEGEGKEGKPSEGGKPSDNPADSKGDGKESKPGEESDDKKNSDDKKPGDKPENGKPDKPGDKGKPSKGKPNKSKPSKGKPSEGKPSEGEPGEPSDQESQDGPPPGEFQDLKQKIRNAQKKMEQAQKKLEAAKRKGAIEEQDKALRELEEAKAELERILRQLREEEMERTLELLEARFRRMLDMQLAVYEGTLRLDKVPVAQRNHVDEMEAGKLSRKETAIALAASQVVNLLKAEGTSVAFPEAVNQLRADMQQISSRLAKQKVGEFTQAAEEDVIEGLEELIAAVAKALEDLEKKKTPPGKSPPPGEPQDPPLVNKIAELKLIRSLQIRINRRTKRYSGMLDGPQAEKAEIIDALSGLAIRQQQIETAVHDLHVGKNK